jgi:hypothetical protein
MVFSASVRKAYPAGFNNAWDPHALYFNQTFSITFSFVHSNLNQGFLKQ